MPRTTRCIRAAVGLWVCFAVGVTSAAAATRIPLHIDEALTPRKVSWPVTTGVPFPRGALTAAENCRLIDDQGKELPLQSRIAATWDRDQQSVRWLTIDFLSQPGRRYFLEFGPEIRRREFPSPLVVTSGESLRIRTGRIEAEFSSTAPAALAWLAGDLNGDGRIDSGEAVTTGAVAGDQYYIDQNGTRFSSADDGNDRQIVVETSGPVRACIRVDGFYTGPKGERIVARRTRYHFFAGLGAIRLVDEFRIIGSTRGTRFRDIGIRFALPGEPADRIVEVDASGEPGNQVASYHWREETASVSAYQSLYRHYGNTACEAAVVTVDSQGETRLAQSDRIGEWMQVRSPRATLTGSLRWLWQQFPKEWEATPEGLTLHLWSPRGGELNFSAQGVRRFCGEAGEKYLLNWGGVNGTLSPISNYFYFASNEPLDRDDIDGLGINKHHEIWLHIGRGDEAEVGKEYAALAALPPLALASGEWNCSTGVFGPLAPRPNDSPYEAIVDRLFDLGRTAQDTFGDYGWWLFGAGPHYSYQWDAEAKRHYADPRRFDFHTYQKETQLWWCYLRSGERKFYDWAIPSENHWVDIAVSHAPTTFHSEWLGGEHKPQDLHWPAGDWSIDSPLHFVRHHNTGEAWLRGGSQFWATYHRTLETTTLAYYLTGDERYNDVIQFWRDYWGPLAGKTSADELPPPYCEQAWYVRFHKEPASRTWAEMIRDYAPFTSGSRHQLTLLFNLATLYEHTWDPEIGRVLQEYADAFLDPGHVMGVWRSQENRLPANAEAPTLAHFWSSALWKYARVTQDPRMPEILRRYYTAARMADPFREHERVGIYSNVHLAYAWEVTRDPQFLTLAQIELNRLLPNAEPLARPEDLNRRLYNPHTLIQSLAAVPRLIAILDEAERKGIAVPPPPLLSLQRTAVALWKSAGEPLTATLWGFDSQLRLISPEGSSSGSWSVDTSEFTTPIEPFDRTPPGFEGYLHRLTIPAEAPEGWYILTPHLELAVLAANCGSKGVLCNAAQPVEVRPGEAWFVPIGREQPTLRLESARAGAFRLRDANGIERAGKVEKNQVVFALTEEDAGSVLQLQMTEPRAVWMRILDRPEETCWISRERRNGTEVPSDEQTRAALSALQTTTPEGTFVAGRFGTGLQIVPGQEFRFADHLKTDGGLDQLFDLRQGTLEFWVKRQWDERLAPVPKVTFLTNGLIDGWSPWKLPLNEWAHVAIVWRPFPRDPQRICVHIYVNGHDQADYRSTWWEGYSRIPYGLPKNGKWLEEFVCRAPPGTAFVIDEIRLSSIPRYADLEIEFGGQQTQNPYRFRSPEEPFAADAETRLLFHLDGDLKSQPLPGSGQIIEGRLSLRN